MCNKFTLKDLFYYIPHSEVSANNLPVLEIFDEPWAIQIQREE